MDTLARAYKSIYSYTDKKTEDYISKQYLGLFRITGMLLKIDEGHEVISMIQLAFYVWVFAFHYFVVISPCSQLLEISFVVFGQSIHFCLLMQLVIIIIIFIQFKRREILSLHRAVVNNFFDYSEPYEGILHQLQREMYRERRILVAIPISVGLAAAIVLCVAPIVDQYGSFDFNKTVALALDDNLPFPFADYPYSTDETFSYYISVVLQMILGFLLSSTIGTGGFLYIVLSQNISLQMKILLDSLAKIEERSKFVLNSQMGVKLSDEQLYTHREFADCYNKCLKNNLKHHQIIMRHFHEWTSLFSLPVFTAYLTGTIVIALSLLSTSSWSELPGTTISSFVLCGAEVGYMYIFSEFSQRITDSNEDLRFQMYSIKWYLCDEDVKRSLRVFQEVTKRPMTLVAGGIVPANMDTFAKVMNSAYSYYNLANAFNVA